MLQRVLPGRDATRPGVAHRYRRRRRSRHPPRPRRRRRAVAARRVRVRAAARAAAPACAGRSSSTASGRRFVNEDTYTGRIGWKALMEHDGDVFMILDESIYERNLLGLRFSYAAETAEELARDIGLPEAAFAATVANVQRARGRRRGSRVREAAAVRAAARSRRSARSTSAWSGARSTRPSRSAGSTPTSTAGCSTPTARAVPGLFAVGRAGREPRRGRIRQRHQPRRRHVLRPPRRDRDLSVAVPPCRPDSVDAQPLGEGVAFGRCNHRPGQTPHLPRRLRAASCAVHLPAGRCGRRCSSPATSRPATSPSPRAGSPRGSPGGARCTASTPTARSSAGITSRSSMSWCARYALVNDASSR